MKRDLTVTLSLAVFVAGRVVDWVAPLPQSERLMVECLWAIQTLACGRALVLWFQTFADACRPAGGKPVRSGWIALHFLFGPLASYPYYYLYRTRGGHALGEGGALSDEALKRQANQGTL